MTKQSSSLLRKSVDGSWTHLGGETSFGEGRLSGVATARKPEALSRLG